MRALVVERPGGPEALRARELPAPLPGPGHVVVAVEAAGVNPVDAGNRADPAWAGLRPPFVVGYELAGTVEATGDGAGWRPGQPVWGLLPVRGTRWGTYAERVALDASLIGPRPEGLSAVEAAALPLAGATALQLLDRLAPRPGEWVLVHDVAGRARQAIGQDLDMVADLVGHRTLAASLPVLREGGRAGSIVELAGDLEPVIDRNITLHGVLMRPGRAVLDALAAEVGAGRLRPVVDQVLDLEDAATAHRRVETGRGQGKVVLRVGG
jgi:NADPH:quinone reductase